MLLSEEAGEAIVIAFYEDENTMRENKGKSENELNDPARTLTDFARLRARAVREHNRDMRNTDWYGVVYHAQG